MNLKRFTNRPAINIWVGKTFLVMRIVFFITVLSITQLFAVDIYSQNARINLNVSNQTVKSVLTEIQKQSEFSFMFNSKIVDVERKVSISAENEKIYQILDKIFESTEIAYTVVDRQIVLFSSKGLATQQPTKKVAGKVTDLTGASVPGTSVVIKGTTTGVVTDLDGGYTLSNIPENAILQFSFVGMKPQEKKVGNESTINVVLTEEAIGIEEVVAIGYGTQIRKNLSSSVAKVDAKNLVSTSATSFEAALEGRAAGLQVVSGSALSGSAVRIRIRGVSSASASSDPLYVIDGVPMESGAISSSQPGAVINEWNLQTAAQTNVLASLNSADIESLEVLKDAAAAAIYGSRGANGVILITTKKGKVGKTQVKASASFGLSDATHRIPLLNSVQYIKLAQEAWYNSGNKLADFWDRSGVLVDGLTKEQAMNTNTDWVDETLRIGNVQDYNISLSGGNEKTIFFMSANLKDEKSILKGNKYMKFGTRLNIEHQVSNRFRVGGNISLSHIENQPVSTSWGGGSGMANFMLPIWPVFKEDGSYFNVSSNNPVAGIDLREMDLISNQILGNWFLKTNIVEGLTFRTELGANMLFNDDFNYRDGRITSHGRSVSATIIGDKISWNWKNILNYTKKIGGHNFDILAAAESQRFRRKENTMFGDTFFNTALKKPQDAAIKNASYSETGYSFLSYIGRVNYDYNRRFLLSGSMRVDGSSRFAPNNRWGYFPAGSVGYILSEESYFKPIKKVFNFMKLRASYGIVGNAEIGNYAYYSTYATKTYNSNTGIVLSNIGDDKLGWESTAQLDLGLTWEAFGGRISGEFDYYNKKTSNLLLPYPVSSLTGVSQVTRNVGELSNIGYEVMLNTINVKKQKFSWETNITLAHNENKVLKLSDELAQGLSASAGIGSVELYVGYPVGVLARSVWGGVDPSTGEDIYIDKDGNKLLYSEILTKYGNFSNFNNTNKKPTGNPWPKISGGIDNRITWKNWYMNIMVTYAAGMDFEVGHQRRSLAAFGNVKYNPYSNVLDRWRNPGDIASVSKLTTDNVVWTSTTESLHRVDYIRLKDLTIGYRLKIRNTSILKGLDFHLKFTNLLTFTKAPNYYWDPEFTNSDDSMGAGNVDSGAPQAKMCILGVTLDF